MVCLLLVVSKTISLVSVAYACCWCQLLVSAAGVGCWCLLRVCCWRLLLVYVAGVCCCLLLGLLLATNWVALAAKLRWMSVHAEQRQSFPQTVMLPQISATAERTFTTTRGTISRLFKANLLSKLKL